MWSSFMLSGMLVADTENPTSIATRPKMRPQILLGATARGLLGFYWENLLCLETGQTGAFARTRRRTRCVQSNKV